MADQLLTVTVYATENIVYEGKIKALTSVNDKGKFDVLPMHINFISIIKDYVILHEKNGNEKRMNLKSGVLKVVSDQVSVFLGMEGLTS